MKRILTAVLAVVCAFAMCVPTTVFGAETTPVKLEISHEWTNYCVGYHACAAIQPVGLGYAWGHNYFGNVGNGQSNSAGVPTPYNFGSGVAQIDTEGDVTIKIDTDGVLWLWGQTYYGAGGTEPSTGYYSYTPVQIDTDVLMADMGTEHIVYVKNDHTMWIYGENHYGELGDGTTNVSYTPTQILTDVVYACAGAYITAAIKTDGSLWMWGYNANGQVGNGSTTNRTTPVQVMTGVATVSVKGYHTMAIKTDGTLWAWGSNEYGQLGNGATADVSTPVQVMTGVAQVSASFYHTGVLKQDGTLWFCGSNYRGPFGNGTSTTYSIANPTFTQTPGTYVAISCGNRMSGAVSTTGQLFMAGENLYGKLGVGYVASTGNGMFVDTLTGIDVWLFGTATTHTVNFVDWDGTVLSTQTVQDGGAASAPANPVRTGYTFTGWDVAFNNVTSDLTVTAQYSINSYVVTFVDWNGLTLSSQSVTYGSAAVAPANPVRTGYTFTGWDVAFNNVTSDITVTAQYSINSYVVTFVDWDGTVLSTQTVDYGSAATAPADPERAGYTFTGWDVEFNNVTSDITVTAQYSSSSLLGDVNCDGVITFADVSLLYAAIVSGAVLSPQGVINADFNQDGVITFSDVAALYSALATIIR